MTATFKKVRASVEGATPEHPPEFLGLGPGPAFVDVDLAALGAPIPRHAGFGTGAFRAARSRSWPGTGAPASRGSR